MDGGETEGSGGQAKGYGLVLHLLTHPSQVREVYAVTYDQAAGDERLEFSRFEMVSYK